MHVGANGVVTGVNDAPTSTDGEASTTEAGK